MIGYVENNINEGVAEAGSLKIIPVSDKDIEACTSVYIKAYNCAPWHYQWTFDKAKQYLQEYKDSPQFVGFALYDHMEMVGAAFAHSKTWWTNNQLMIDEFFVAQERQGRGYGKKLLDFCSRYCVQNQIESVVLMTSKYMPSYDFYEKNGYTTIDPYVFLFKQASDQ